MKNLTARWVEPAGTLPRMGFFAVHGLFEGWHFFTPFIPRAWAFFTGMGFSITDRLQLRLLKLRSFAFGCSREWLHVLPLS